MRTTDLANAMFISGGFACMGVVMMVYALVESASPFSRWVVTQRRRYTFLALGQGILAAYAVWLLSLGSIGDIATSTGEMLAIPVIGWVVGSGVVLVAVSPLISALALIRIYRRPALIAYRRCGYNAYCTTASRRAGKPEFVRSIIVIDPIDVGGSFRAFLPCRRSKLTENTTREYPGETILSWAVP